MIRINRIHEFSFYSEIFINNHSVKRIGTFMVRKLPLEKIPLATWKHVITFETYCTIYFRQFSSIEMLWNVNALRRPNKILPLLNSKSLHREISISYRKRWRKQEKNLEPRKPTQKKKVGERGTVYGFGAAFPRTAKWKRDEGRKAELVSQTVRKQLTPRIKWYRNETIVEQMPGHKTTASSFPPPIALSTPAEQAN